MRCRQTYRLGAFRWAVLLIALLVGAGAAWVRPSQAAGAGGTIPLSVRCIGTAQVNAPVFTGIPFPPGRLRDASRIDLVTDGQSVPRQVRVLSVYPDGSLRVVLIGFRATLAVGQAVSAELRYDGAAGTPLSPEMPWSRNLDVLALLPPGWYGASGVFNLPFLASADNTLFPPFETWMRNRFTKTSDPPTETSPDRRNYYDHVHALYMTLLRSAGPDSAPRRIRDELLLYREAEILHSGTYRGQYKAGTVTGNGYPIPFGVVRRMFPQGLLEDYYFTGDPRSLEVAKEIGEAYLTDAYLQGARFTWTERIPGWELMGLSALYEATLDTRYLDAARHVAAIVMAHQDAMALKYPNQGGVTGQTGGFLQDRNGVWFDPEESTVSGAGSPFMTALLAEGLIRLYWLTGDPAVRDSLLRACDWLADAAYAAADDPRNTSGTDTFWYVCLDTNAGTTYSLNPMFLQMLGFAHQATGEGKYLEIAERVLAVNAWGNHIKEFNQGMHSSGQGLYLLQFAPGSVPLTLSEMNPSPRTETGITAYAASGRIGQKVSLRAKLTASGAALAGKTVSFSLDGGDPVGSALTGSTGVATFYYVIPEALTLGTHQLTAAFAGDADYLGCSGESTLSVSQGATTLGVPNIKGMVGRTVTLLGTLRRTGDAAPLPGRTLTFSVDGAPAGAALTDAKGTARLKYPLTEAAGVGVKGITVEFAGDDRHTGCSKSSSLTASPATTRLTVTRRSVKVGQTVLLTATLKRATDGALLPGRTVTFSVNGVVVGSAVTSATGVASRSYVIPAELDAGTHPLQASFAGDAAHQPTTGSSSLVVSL